MNYQTLTVQQSADGCIVIEGTAHALRLVRTLIIGLLDDPACGEIRALNQNRAAEIVVRLVEPEIGPPAG